MINLMQLWAVIQKEWLLLSRDLHGLLLLFVMPVAFILIMSLALQDSFAEHTGVHLKVLVSDLEQSELSGQLLAMLNKYEMFTLRIAAMDAQLKRPLQEDGYAFCLTIPATFSQGLTQANANETKNLLQLRVASTTSRQVELIFLARLREAVGLLQWQQLMYLLGDTLPAPFANLNSAALMNRKLVDVTYGYAQQSRVQAPTSVQQNVPAWLVFSMFFVVVPLSNTLINERRLGTLKRLQAININPLYVFVGKLLPYFVINQVQVIMMLLVGMYVVPWLGGDRLMLGNSISALVCIAAAVSIAALGYGMLIAVIARSSEQATILGGTGNILLAAIGGIMVPKFIMPEPMQQLTVISPMSWGLEGFLEIFLKHARLSAILTEVMALLFFGILAIVLALGLFMRKVP